MFPSGSTLPSSRRASPSRARLALLAGLLGATPLTAQLAAFPASVHYQGEAQAANGQRLEGRFEVEARVFDKRGERELWRERFASVDVHVGRFALELGRGQSEAAAPRPFASLQEVFEANYQVELELSFDGQRFGPRVGLLPAGHSLESRLVIDGRRQPNDRQRHWKWYTKRTEVSSFRATVLSPDAADRPALEDATTRSGPFLLPMEGPWLSRPVRDLPLASQNAHETASKVDEDEEVSPDPNEINPLRHESLVDSQGRPFGTVPARKPDPLAELSAQRGPFVGSTPALSTSFEGLDNIDGFYPPDTEMAVGPSHIVQVTNVTFAVYDKSGTMVSGPFHTNLLWSSLPASDACRVDNDGDAIFLYDWQADRFVLAQFAVTSGEKVCFAVSTTNDPTGTYYLYTLPTQRFPDYFKLGIWPDAANNAYFMGTNSGFQGQYDIYAIDRENLLAGLAPRTAQFFQSFANLQLPADNDGPALPPAGSPGIFYSFRDGGEPYFGSPATDSLDVREFHVDWTTPASSTSTLVQSLTPAQGLVDFNWTVCGFFESNCLAQPGTGVKIDSASWWPMQRLQYRNFSDRQTLVGTWTVDTLASGDHAAPRWFELRRGTETSGNWTIFQQGTHSPDATDRWMGSIAMDGSGNIALGYSAVSAATSLYPSIRYATRLSTDTLGVLQAEATLQTGTGAQTGSAGRWGDYSSMEVDPADDCTFWFTTEYLTTTGSVPWRTRVGSFVLPECSVADFMFRALQSTATVCPPGSASYDLDVRYFTGLTGDINLSASGNPPGTSVSFTTNPLNPGSLTSTMTINGITAANNGAHSITITATSAVGSIVHSRVVTLQVGAPGGTPALLSPADGSTTTGAQPSFQWTSVPGAGTSTIEIASDAAFTSIVDSATVGTLSHTPSSPLAVDSQFWWRVRANNDCGSGPNAGPFTFHTPLLYCRDPNIAIPDNSAVGVSDNLTIAATGTLDDVNVYLKVNHTWIGDLTFTLQKSAQTSTLIDRPGYTGSGFGCSSDNIDAWLDDEGGAGPVENACPPLGGSSFTPNSPLTVFDGQTPNGTWTLTAKDLVSGDTGTLVQWCIAPIRGFRFVDDFEVGNTSAWSASFQ